MGKRPHSAGAATALPGIVREALDDGNAGGCDTLETAELIFCSRSATDLGDEFYQRADEGPPRNVGEGAANLFSTNPPSRLDGLRESDVSIDRSLTAGGAKVGIATLTSTWLQSNGGKRLSAYRARRWLKAHVNVGYWLKSRRKSPIRIAHGRDGP
jgi:hypothetical protein